MAAHRDWRLLRCENGHEHQGYLGETGPGFQEWRPHAECPDCGCQLFSRDEIEDMDPFAGDGIKPRTDGAMKIEIKHRFSSEVLFETEAATVRAAVVEAYLREADLRGAYLREVDLRGADLGGADLGGADLGGAYLGGAYLREAYLRGADLREVDLRGADLGGVDLGGAYLRGAYLRGAYLGSSPLFMVRIDLWDVLDQTPGEVAGLRAALIEGRVNGSTYEGPCACLVGTIANVRGCPIEKLPVAKDASRPAELWFLPIGQGDVPDDASLEVVTVGKDDPKPESVVLQREEGVFRATLAVQWIDEWVVSRTALVAALAAAGI